MRILTNSRWLAFFTASSILCVCGTTRASEPIAEQSTGTAAAAAPMSPTPTTAESSAAAPAEQEALTNLQRPIHLQWQVLGELAMPGILGVRLGASFYVPSLPLMVGAQFSQDWGLSPSHLAGERSSTLTRQLAASRNIEARVGLVHSSWAIDEWDVTYDTNFASNGSGTTFDRQTYSTGLPTDHQRSLFVGYRSRTAPGRTSCPNSLALPEDCAENQQRFFLLGINLLSAYDLNMQTAENGLLHAARQRDIDIHLLFTPDATDYGRNSVGKRIGAEFTVTSRKSLFAVMYGLGWDGELALLTLAIGAGANHSFGGVTPATSSIH